MNATDARAELRRRVMALLGSDLDRETMADIAIDVVVYGLERAHSVLRRARLQAARELGRHTPAQWRALVAKHGGRCARCGTTKNITKDHIVSIAAGGSDGIENLQPLCGPCNSSKGAS